MTGDKIADKITSVSKKKSAKSSQNNETEKDVEIAAPKKWCISPEERKKIIEELRLVLKNVIDYWWIEVNIEKDTYLPNKENKLMIN